MSKVDGVVSGDHDKGVIITCSNVPKLSSYAYGCIHDICMRDSNCIREEIISKQLTTSHDSSVNLLKAQFCG